MQPQNGLIWRGATVLGRVNSSPNKLCFHNHKMSSKGTLSTTVLPSFFFFKDNDCILTFRETVHFIN